MKKLLLLLFVVSGILGYFNYLLAQQIFNGINSIIDIEIKRYLLIHNKNCEFSFSPNHILREVSATCSCCELKKEICEIYNKTINKFGIEAYYNNLELILEELKNIGM